MVTSNSRILAKGWGSPAAKMMQQNLERAKEENWGKGQEKGGREKKELRKEKERINLKYVNNQMFYV